MFRAFAISFLILAFLATDASAQRPVFDGISPELQELVNIWLYRNCGVNDDSLAAALGRHRSDLEPVFWEAFERGPDPAQLAADSVAATNLYVRRARWLREFGRATLGEADTRRLLAMPADSLVAAQRATIVTAYKERALIGLGHTGMQQTRQRLQLIGHDPSHAYRRSAEHALRRIRDRLGP